MVGGETEVTVTVTMHWYSDSEQGELQTEPMAQHTAFEPVAASTMQYVSSGQQEAAPRGPISLPEQDNSQLQVRRSGSGASSGL